jgi:23S rRNA pseudouridine1911/1915/1917 synthase
MKKLEELSFPPILYQDEDIVVINKPAGLIVQKSHTHTEPTLDQLLPANPELERQGIVHRLDRDTSGVMVIARTSHAQQDLQRQFSNRLVEKEYVALVWGEFPDAHAIVDAPILRHPSLGYKYVVANQGGREAKTEIWRQQIYSYEGEPLSFLRLKLHSGRTHQARVHLFAMGYPLVGDKVYGRRKDKTGLRQFLHARQLGFIHPTSHQHVQFTADIPQEMQQFLNQISSVN